MTRITTPFTARSTAREVVEGLDLAGTRIVVTGGASGIGVETARALVAAGADVTIAARRMDQAEEVLADIRRSTDSGTVQAAYLDLQKRDTLQAFADDWHGPLDVLIDNAGVMATPETRTPRAGSCSSATTTSATSRSRTRCGSRWSRARRRRARRRDWCRSARPVTTGRRSCSTT